VEVVVHDVDKERRVHELRYEFLRRRVVFIKFGPLCTQFEGLILCKNLFNRT
jgi:hypothetical protein